MLNLGSSTSTEETTAYTFDGAEHTPDNPYCGDIGHWCHTNVQYHEQVMHPQPTEEELAEALAFLEIQ